MAWLTTATTANKAIDRTYNEPDIRTFYTVLGTATVWARTVAVTEYRYIGMAYANAVTAAAAIEDDDTTAVVETENNGGGYTVRVVKRTYTTWSSP